MHRNIFFRDCAKVPERRSARSIRQAPEDLWDWMDAQRQGGNELLAISHNANLSDGIMFPTDVDSKAGPIDEAWADVARPQRAPDRNQADQGPVRDPSAPSPNDEFANYEILTTCSAIRRAFPTIPGSYVRQG